MVLYEPIKTDNNNVYEIKNYHNLIDFMRRNNLVEQSCDCNKFSDEKK